MNLAVGFPCPMCGCEEANLLKIEKDENAEPISFRFVCTSCETVFRELREPAAEPSVSSGRRGEG